MSDHSARPRIESVATFVLQTETIPTPPEPVAWYRFEDEDKSHSATCTDTMGNYPGQYYLNDGVIDEIDSLLPPYDPTEIAIEPKGLLDFGGGGVQLSGEPRGCVLVDDLHIAMDGSGDSGRAPFTVAFWSKSGDGYEGGAFSGAESYDVIWPDESQLNIVGNIFQHVNGPGPEDDTYSPYPAGVISCMAPSDSGPGREGWSVTVQGGEVVFGRYISGGVIAPYAYEISSGPLPIMETISGRPRSQVIFCSYDGTDMYIYSSPSIELARVGARDDPWLSTVEATNELASAGEFAIGSANLAFPFSGGWANWMQGSLDDVMCWDYALSVDEMREVYG